MLAAIPTFQLASALAQGNAATGQSRLSNKIVLYAQIKEVPELPGGPETPETRGLFAIDPDTGAYTKLADVGGLVRVSPDGAKAAFAKFGPPRRDNRQDREGTWLVDLVAKTEPRKLIAAAGHIFWSAESQRLLVSEWGQKPGDPGPSSFTTWQVNADGSDMCKLAISDYVCDWSSDGQWLAVLTDRGAEPKGSPQISVCHLDGTAIQRITRGEGQSVNARFSPDNKQLAYLHREGDKGPEQIMLVDADGKNSRVFLEEKNLKTPTSFAWAPDGKSLVVTTMSWKLAADGTKYMDKPTEAGIEIQIVGIDGKNLRTVPLPTLTWLGEPQWL